MSKKLRVNVQVAPSDILKTEQSLTLNVQDNTSWSDVCAIIKEKLSTSVAESLAFQYLDDVADYISGCTEEEWKDAISVGSTKSRDELVLHIKALPTKNVSTEATKAASSSNSTCCVGTAESRKTWCCYKRPHVENPVDDGIIPEKIVNPQSSSYKYANQALWAVTLPLGPIGGGSIALAGDGGLRQWQVVNSVCHDAHVPNSFFAIKVDDGSSSSSVVLQSNTLYDATFKPEPRITDQYVPEASKELLKELPGVKTIEITAKYPIAEVDFLSKEVPVEVSLEAFNPCIPLNSKDSGIPAIIFNYKVKNTNSKPVQVSLLGSMTNFIGWDGKTIFTPETFNDFVGSNQNTLLTYEVPTNDKCILDEYSGVDGFRGIYMNNPVLDEKHISNGEIMFGVLAKVDDIMHESCFEYSDAKKDLWDFFESTEGLPGEGRCGVSCKDQTYSGATSCRREIQPGQEETFTFILAWHFPYRFFNWSEDYENSKSLYYLGNHYSTVWKNVEEVMQYTGQNIERLTLQTRQFRDAMFDSTLPWQLIDSAAGRLSVPRSPTFMWLEDGNLYCFEGCSPTAGCCPLNCTHVLNYEMAVAKCFPDLERTMREVDLCHNISPNYIIPSRTILPLELKCRWEDWNWNDPSSPIDLSSTTICLDGDLGTVLKTYREIRQGASLDYFNKWWPKIKEMMNRYMTQLDDGNGVISKAQPCTYDVATYGVDTFIGCLYLCALRAAQEMAKLQNDEDNAKRYHDRFLKGSCYLDKLCFPNGKWYTQVVPQGHPTETLSDGTFIDALIGQWWAHALGLGYLLPQEHIQSHLQWVFKRNHVDSFNPADQHPRQYFDQRDAGLYITSWGDEKKPDVPLEYSCEGAWSGLEHSFAGLCLYENLNDIALHVVKDCRDKYDGTRRSPWNEIECGDHYARPMAAFLYFEIVAGMTWQIVAVGEKTLKLNFAPTLSPEKFKGFFIVGSGWGSYSQEFNKTDGDVQLAVTYGEVDIVELGLALDFSTAKVTLDGTEIKSVLTPQGGGKIILTFPQTLTSDNVLIIKEGQTLNIMLSHD